ncbi:MAG TPA: UvrD-helicase domain-containing protein, partial [Candidatus Binatia bacterium]|nr:UvrD-helicase domain-containing protein [Candidatus Binatia bacterium]
MEVQPAQNNSLTPSQQQAVTARGNVLVMAGAGTGKTKTLVERCLDCLERERAGLDELLIVTFTEAAAAEMRQRLRKQLEQKAAAHPADEHWPKQLALFDVAHIGTLHSFCLRLVREHFYELGLDPQFAVLDEGETRQRANETLDEIFQAHYAGDDEFSMAVQNLIQIYGGGRDENIRKLVLRLHNYSQARPDPAGWLAGQIGNFFAFTAAAWQRWLLEAIAGCRNEWLPVLENLQAANAKAAELKEIIFRVIGNFSRESAAEILEQVVSADGEWPAKKKTVLRKPLEKIFDEAAFLASLAVVKAGTDPLAEDWSWVRGQMVTLLRLAQEFAGGFSGRKLADGVLDFHDLEQFALKLLWDFTAGCPTTVARAWQKKLKFIFVDEYQDINAAQDKIIQALSCDRSAPVPGGNRFLVGDVKQSIYRFRLADPKIFRDYAHIWRNEAGGIVSLSENFRSREGLLDFVNSVCRLVMREEVGGVGYDADAELKPGRRPGETPGGPDQSGAFGQAAAREDPPPQNISAGQAARPTVVQPRVDLLLRFKAGRNDALEDADGELADLDEAQKEARLVALRLKKLVEEKHAIWDGHNQTFRTVKWGDVAI